MSEVAGELARVRSAFQQPTLTLLHQRQAPVVIAFLRSAFGRDNRPIPTARLHAQVEDHLTQLRLAGETELPAGSGRDICQRWMRGQWLVRALDDAGQEVYSLTSHAQQALELVKNLARDRATLSEHRIATILNTVRRFNSEANPDRSARVAILNAEIARLGAERDRLVDGAEMDAPSEDYMLEGFTELQLLISALPSDFARVEERFAQIRAEILASFRAEDRPAGQLRDDLGALLDHPLSGGILGDADRAELRGTVRLVRDGLDRVLSQRSRVTSTLKDYIVAHDAARDRELEQTLRQIESEVMGWMATSGPRASLDLPLLPARVDVEHFRERFHDPADDVAPTRLVDTPTGGDAPPSLATVLAQGGPSISVLRRRLDEALASLDPAASLGEVFDSLEPELRRPVEIFGLLHLAADRELPAETVLERYHALRPDGSQRTFAVPRVPLDDPDLTARTEEPR